MKRFAPFSYLNHSFTFSPDVKTCIMFIAFLQISLCFFICQELCWMRGFWISFTSSCFLFQIGGEKIFEDWGKGIKKIRIGGGGGRSVCWGGLVPHYMPQCFPEYLYGHRFIVINGQKPLKSVFKRSIISCSPHIQKFFLCHQNYCKSIALKFNIHLAKIC